MTTTRTAKTRAARHLGVSTLALAAAVALEIAGLRALDPSATDTAVVASIDGTAVASPAATPLRKPAPVEVRIVAQADLPAR